VILLWKVAIVCYKGSNLGLAMPHTNTKHTDKEGTNKSY